MTYLYKKIFCGFQDTYDCIAIELAEYHYIILCIYPASILLKKLPLFFSFRHFPSQNEVFNDSVVAEFYLQDIHDLILQQGIPFYY